MEKFIPFTIVLADRLLMAMWCVAVSDGVIGFETDGDEGWRTAIMMARDEDYGVVGKRNGDREKQRLLVCGCAIFTMCCVCYCYFSVECREWRKRRVAGVIVYSTACVRVANPLPQNENSGCWWRGWRSEDLRCICLLFCVWAACWWRMNNSSCAAEAVRR